MIRFFLNTKAELSCQIDSKIFERIYCKKSFPLDKAGQSVLVFSETQREIACFHNLLDFSEQEKLWIEDSLAKHSPIIYVEHILDISSFAFPNRWSIIVGGEKLCIQVNEQEDLSTYPEYGTLIKDANGQYYLIPLISELDKNTQRKLSPFILS